MGDGAPEVIRFILGEATFPRSVAYCLAGVQSAARRAAAQRVGRSPRAGRRSPSCRRRIPPRCSTPTSCIARRIDCRSPSAPSAIASPAPTSPTRAWPSLTMDRPLAGARLVRADGRSLRRARRRRRQRSSPLGVDAANLVDARSGRDRSAPDGCRTTAGRRGCRPCVPRRSRGRCAVGPRSGAVRDRRGAVARHRARLEPTGPCARRRVGRSLRSAPAVDRQRHTHRSGDGLAGVSARRGRRRRCAVRG